MSKSDCPTDRPCYCEPDLVEAQPTAAPPLPAFPSYVEAERVIVEGPPSPNRQPGWILHNFSKTACHHASARLPPGQSRIDETTIDCLGPADFAAFRSALASRSVLGEADFSRPAALPALLLAAALRPGTTKYPRPGHNSHGSTPL